MPYNRMNLSEFGKDEVFLYTLESYKTIEWSDVIIYCEVSEDFPDNSQKLGLLESQLPNVVGVQAMRGEPKAPKNCSGPRVQVLCI